MYAFDQIGTLWLHSTKQQLLYSCNRYFVAEHCFVLSTMGCFKVETFLYGQEYITRGGVYSVRYVNMGDIATLS